MGNAVLVSEAGTGLGLLAIAAQSDFLDLRAQLADKLLETEPENHGKWQQLDVSGSSAHDTHELLNTTIWYEMPNTMSKLKAYVQPDLPWAENHFQERVAGSAINPGVEHNNWPYHANGAELHIAERPRTIDSRDWAYLAALIDADGSISYLKKNGESVGRPRVQVTQKDHAFLDSMFERYGFGKVSYREGGRETRTPDGKIRRSNAGTWHMGGKALTRYVLVNIEPYLVLKRGKAQEAIRVLDSLPAHHSDVALELATEKIYDHNYMERFWPKFAGNAGVPSQGIRYPVGDLQDVVNQLKNSKGTRQAYLPIFHPEDTGATQGQRVPCTLGYHFIVRDDTLHMTYNMRSCEIYRHFTNDVYMAVRLAEWVAWHAFQGEVTLGQLTMNIVSLHGFVGDRNKIQELRYS